MRTEVKTGLQTVGDSLLMQEGRWDFAQAVDAFDRHVDKSIPFCREGRDYVAKLATFFVRPNSLVYEIGVSTGALAVAVLGRVAGREFQYVGIDVVPGMVERANSTLSRDPRFSGVIADAVGYNFDQASLFLSYYTLHFIRLQRRAVLMGKIYQALELGGALIMYEKIRAPDARFQDMLTQLYMEFKQGSGFKSEEIINKSKALKSVSEPFTTEENLTLLRHAGFRNTMVIHKAYCFEGYLAVK